MSKRAAPGRSHRDGMSIIELMAMFPTDDTATAWFESVVWPGERCCGHCGSVKTREVPNRKPMPYWCSDCREYFSVRTGTAIAHSKVPLRKWAIAIYLERLNPSSCRLSICSHLMLGGQQLPDAGASALAEDSVGRTA